MSAFAYAERWGHEEIVLLRDARSGLRAIIALHDTTLGPAIGGTRMRTYASEDDALLDALRLARAMTGVTDIRALDATSPFGHVCQPIDVARVVLWLCSEGAGYVTGQRIECDGGGTLASY